MPEERPRRTEHKQTGTSSPNGWQLIAVQGISCVVVILIALLFRLIGGSAFAQLRESFNESIMSNSIIATFSAMLDTTPVSDSSAESTSGSKTAAASAGTNSTGTTGTSSAGTSGSSATTAATTVVNNKTSVAAAGGQDIAVSVSSAILFPPEGATFVPLKMNRLANKPLETGTISSGFGYRQNPTKGGESFHKGIDIAAAEGSPIAAMYYGIVEEVGKSSSYGNYIKINHGNGLVILYAHCSEILAPEGAVIRAGEIVAKVGSTGDSTGPHLHVETILNGVVYNPSGAVPVADYV